MLIKAEKILTHNDIEFDQSDAKIFELVTKELTEKIANDLIVNHLVKVQITNETNDDDDALCKVKASVMAYNPDD